MNKNLLTLCLGRSVTQLVLSVALGTALLLLPSAATAAVGDVDGFNPSLNAGTAYSATVQPDGKILLGAVYFSGLTRVQDNGSFDPGFPIVVNSAARCIAVQPDGKILVGGSFTTVGGVSRNNIARVNPDGTLDASFNASCNGTVNSILLHPDGKILIGGNFTSVGGQTRNRIAQLDSNGVVRTNFNISANGEVRTMAMQADGKILLAGLFNTLGVTSRPAFGRLNTDGTLDTNFNVSLPSGAINSIVLQPDGKILVAGNFTSLAGEVRNYIGRLLTNGALDTNFTPNINVYVQSVALQADGKILAGGWFTSPSGFAMGTLAKMDANGMVETNFNPAINSSLLQSMDLQADGKLIIGGQNLISVNGQQRRSFARLLNDPATESVVVSSNHVQWLRGGSAPEVRQVTFEVSTNGGLSHTLLGSGTRINGGWELTGVTLPAAGYVRARGHTSGGYFNNSSGLVEGLAYFGAITAMNLSAAETYVEDTPLNLADIKMLSGDGTNVTASLTLSTPSAGSLSTVTSNALNSTYNATTGVWVASGTIANVNALLAGVTFNPATNFNANFTIATSVSDGGTTLTDVKVMTGTPVNDRPTATNLATSENYQEDTPRDLSNIVVTDVDGDLVTATLTLSTNQAGRLSTGTVGVTVSTFDTNSGIWSATGPVADVNALLAGVTFLPATNYNAHLQIFTSITDGVSPPVTGTKGITGIPVNDPPSAVNLSAPETYLEDTPLNLIDIVVSDPDSGVNASLILSPASAGSLSTGTSGAVTSTFNQAQGNWFASGPVSDINALLAGVVFTPSSNSSANFSILTTFASDNGGNPTLGAKSVTGVAVNDPPTLNTITNIAIAQNSGLQTVGLNGISAGGGEAQALSVTATSGNTNVIPNPTVNYTSPATNGSLSFTPVANAVGSALITVTVNDGAASNNVVTRIFTVTVSTTGGEIGVEQPAGTPVADGGARDFGSISFGSQTSLAFTVTNSGPASLTNLGVTLDGADASHFTLLFPQTYGTLVLTSSPPVNGNPVGVTVADVNGDARPDLISASSPTSLLTVLTNNGSGGFVLSSTPATGTLPIAVVAADVNGDGRMDIISANDAGGTLSILTNDGSGGFVLSSSPLVGARVSAVVAGDMNGDGAIDLVAAYRGEFFTNNALAVLTNRAGLFTIASTPVVEAITVSLAVGDFNEDGRMDLVSVSADTAGLTVLTNHGTGFAPAPAPPPAFPVASVTTADVNGDGRMDLLCPYYFGVLMVMTNSGNSVFMNASAPTLSAYLQQVTTADLNGDGKLDALAVDLENSLLVVATNGGGGLFEPAYSRAVGGNPRLVAAADVNGDGKPDAITANYNDSTLSVLFNTSAGATNLPPTLAPGSSTTFGVRFAPWTIGPKTAALHLTSSDTDETPYDITLIGTGVGGVTPPGIDRRSLQRLPDGSFRFTFTNAPGLIFTVLSSTNVALPHQDWTALGPVVESPAGRYQFTDPQATNTSIRFYRVRSP